MYFIIGLLTLAVAVIAVQHMARILGLLFAESWRAFKSLLSGYKLRLERRHHRNDFPPITPSAQDVDWVAESAAIREKIIGDGPRRVRAGNILLNQVDMDILMMKKKSKLAQIEIETAAKFDLINLDHDIAAEAKQIELMKLKTEAARLRKKLASVENRMEANKSISKTQAPMPIPAEPTTQPMLNSSLSKKGKTVH